MNPPIAAHPEAVAQAGESAAGRAPRRSQALLLAWSFAGISLVATIGIVGFSLPLVRASGFTVSTLLSVAWGPLLTVYAVVGMAILRRYPTHRVGWTLLIAGLIWSLAQVTYAYGQFGIQVSPGSVPFPVEVLQIGCFYPFGL